MTTPVSYLPTTLNPSGLDDSAIISSLVAVQQQPITALQTHRSNLQTQVSILGSLSSDLTALNTAAQNLATGGAVANQVTSSNTSFTATAGSGSTAGSYSVQVTQLATTASAQSQVFASPNAPVTVGSSPPLVITINGIQYGDTYDNFNITNNESLANVAQGINASGAPVSAIVLTNAGGSYLELTSAQTGSANDILVTTNNTNINLTTTGALDATLTVDGVAGITSSSNSVSDVIPGVTLALSSQGGPAENLTIAPSASGTTANLQDFVGAYNLLSQTLTAQLDSPPKPGSSAPPPPLASDPATISLQLQIQQLLGTSVAGLNLASIGVLDTSGTGTLSIDQAQLVSALASNPQGINTLFSDASAGLGTVMAGLTTEFTAPAVGAITGEVQNTTQQISDISTKVTQAQAQLATFQKNLAQQFANMEKVVSGFKSAQMFLTNQEAALAAQSGLGMG